MLRQHGASVSAPLFLLRAAPSRRSWSLQGSSEVTEEFIDSVLLVSMDTPVLKWPFKSHDLSEEPLLNSMARA